jgi:hypothetical protein
VLPTANGGKVVWAVLTRSPLSLPAQPPARLPLSQPARRHALTWSNRSAVPASSTRQRNHGAVAQPRFRERAGP